MPYRVMVVGLSPAWQQIYRFDGWAEGEVNRAREAVACASGKVINVVRALTRLGVRTTGLSIAGGSAGEMLKSACESEGLDMHWLEVGASSRVCTTILDDTGAVGTTEMVENCASLRKSELKAYANQSLRMSPASDALVVTGSLPADTPEAFLKTLVRDYERRVYLDIRGPELSACLPERPYLVKPNREELAATLGEGVDGDEAFDAGVEALCRMGAECAVVSDGLQALRVSGQSGKYRMPALLSRNTNPIGCGDCLMAGIVAGIGRGMGEKDAIVLGIAAAAENADTLLPADIKRDRVLRRAAEASIGVR